MKKDIERGLLLFAAVFFLFSQSHPQWQKTSGPAGGFIGCMAASGHR
jgi:hypothetical protein